MRWKWCGLGVAIQLLALSIADPGLAEVVKITILHLNDIYEIQPVSGGKQGGPARVAYLRQQLLRQNPRTYTVLAGDAVSPSALGTAKVDGQPLAGKQMIAVLNQMGLDYATFGNHEFDIKQEQFNQRLAESKFRWFSGNVTDATGQPFPNVSQNIIFIAKSDQGTPIRVGLIGVTLPSNPASYVRYQDAIATAQQQARALRSKVDVLLAVTHLAIEQDRQLATTVPEIDLILGGHEHENIQQWRWVSKPSQNPRCGIQSTPIFKADANVRTIYIHDLSYNTTTKCLKIDSRLQPITDTIPDDPATAKVVNQWVDTAFKAFRANGFEPTQVVATVDHALDGLEESIRNRPTQLSELIAQSMLREVPGADLAVFNGGSIRVDDVLPPGPITQYDIIRILPFGGNVVAIEMKGSLLKKVLDQGEANQGNGGYLHTANVTKDNQGNWQIQGQSLASDRLYRVAINDFLLTGKEQNLGFLNQEKCANQPSNCDFKVLETKRDIRLAMITQLQNQRSATPNIR